MPQLSFPVFAVATLVGVFALAGTVQLVGPRFVRDVYQRWEFAPGFYRVTAVLDLLAAVFLAVPETRLWGIGLAGMIIFAAVATLLGHRKYLHAVPGMLLLMALAPAALTVWM
ncbi:MAG: DoxX family protein [Alphaproteobacteria bacterium]|nr:DoxX family protein [Alphaproteobacteria bacterium]MDE2109837.1 DoxX family protein [Alphaproteobacteria bacterium]MDE2493521.1 DoxX family protein [Alphaproteobacteria bacterium]